jgi:hypothetical protein
MPSGAWSNQKRCAVFGKVTIGALQPQCYSVHLPSPRAARLSPDMQVYSPIPYALYPGAGDIGWNRGVWSIDSYDIICITAKYASARQREFYFGGGTVSVCIICKYQLCVTYCKFLQRLSSCCPAIRIDQVDGLCRHGVSKTVCFYKNLEYIKRCLTLHTIFKLSGNLRCIRRVMEFQVSEQCAQILHTASLRTGPSHQMANERVCNRRRAVQSPLDAISRLSEKISGIGLGAPNSGYNRRYGASVDSQCGSGRHMYNLNKQNPVIILNTKGR